MGLKLKIADSKETGVYLMMAEKESKFVKVRCTKCKNEQIIFSKSATLINCLVCQKPLCEPTGGKSRINGHILEVLQ